LQLVVFIAAAAPTRNEPCSSAKISGVTFGSSTELSSTIANCTWGASAATTPSAVAYLKPTAMIGLKPSETSWRSRVAAASSLSLAAAASSLTLPWATPRSLIAFSRPAAAASLNEPSPRPPMS
jgi:hypothetical protein